jgi:hypothetical protein
MRRYQRILTVGLAAGAVALWQAALAWSQPLPPPPYIPGFIEPVPGAYGFPYDIIIVGPPATFDARGVNITAGVDPSQSAIGMPGSALGNSAPPPNAFTGANALYGISAGGVNAPAPPGTVNITAGRPPIDSLEDPSGKPPSNPSGFEAAAPTVAPPLEDPRSNRPSD